MTIFIMDNLQSDSERWNAVNWEMVEAIVYRIQTRIVKAVFDSITAGCLTTLNYALPRAWAVWLETSLYGSWGKGGGQPRRTTRNKNAVLQIEFWGKF